MLFEVDKYIYIYIYSGKPTAILKLYSRHLPVGYSIEGSIMNNLTNYANIILPENVVFSSEPGHYLMPQLINKSENRVG